MSGAEPFLDTSVLLYLLSGDAAKADRVEDLLYAHGVVSVQVLNEFSVVALRKLKMPLNEICEILDTIRAVCSVVPITVETHDRGLEVFERYKFSLCDSMLVAAALIAGAKILYSEDLQDGQVIDSQLRVTNPF